MSNYAIVKCYERSGYVHRATVLSVASLKTAMPIERCEKFEVESIHNYSSPMFRRNLFRFIGAENRKRAKTIGYRFAKHKDLMLALMAQRKKARAEALKGTKNMCAFSRGTEYVFMDEHGERMDIERWAGNKITKKDIQEIVEEYKDRIGLKEIWLDNGYDLAASPKDYHEHNDYDPAVAFAEVMIWEKRA